VEIDRIPDADIQSVMSTSMRGDDVEGCARDAPLGGEGLTALFISVSYSTNDVRSEATSNDRYRSALQATAEK
jgi:hypothetical protein